jgi:K+-sensing histidine kinase KdpD
MARHKRIFAIIVMCGFSLLLTGCGAKEKEKARAAQAEAEVAKAQLEEVKKALAATETQRDILKTQVQLTATELDRLRSELAAAADWKKKYDVLMVESENLKGLLEREQAQARELVEKLSQNHKTIKELQDKLKAVKLPLLPPVRP